jgi:dTDP-4-dehydrorhamnose 3,5-epimerase
MQDDIVIIQDKYFEERGNIYTIYDKRKVPEICNFVQDKISKSFQGVIRGFHGDNSTWKLITCLHGRIKLVTYNIDNDDKNVYYLDADDPETVSVLIAPRTLNAHQCLSDTCTFYYKWSEFYTKPEDQWSVHYNDQDIKPEWNEEYHHIISKRDLSSQTLKELKKNVNS